LNIFDNRHCPCPQTSSSSSSSYDLSCFGASFETYIVSKVTETNTYQPRSHHTTLKDIENGMTYSDNMYTSCLSAAQSLPRGGPETKIENRERQKKDDLIATLEETRDEIAG
jgi:hypothetical protein